MHISTLVHSRNTGDKPELIILWLYSYIRSSASGVSALLVCTALHIHKWHAWTSQNSSTVSSSVILIHTGLLERCRAATALCTVSVGWSVYTMYLHIHLPVLVDILHGRHEQLQSHSCRSWLSPVVSHMHVSTSIYRNTWSILGHTRISGTRVQQTRGKWYIDR